MPKAIAWTPQQLQDIVTSYEQGESASSLGRRYGTSEQVIKAHLIKQGVTFRSQREANTRRTCDEYYFHTIDTEEKAYWLGFVTADGCITSSVKRPNEKPRVGIHLGKQDYGHLMKFKQALQATQTISENERSCQFVICSSQMAIDLAQHGIMPRKTLSTKPAQVAPHLERHYWRGVVDGDGYISKDRQQVVLVGDYEVVLGFQKFVLTHCPKVKARIFRDLNIYTFKITGTAAERMLEVLYGGATVYLERKYELACPDFP